MTHCTWHFSGELRLIYWIKTYLWKPFCILQVSWIRHHDTHLLTTGKDAHIGSFKVYHFISLMQTKQATMFQTVTECICLRIHFISRLMHFTTILSIVIWIEQIIELHHSNQIKFQYILHHFWLIFISCSCSSWVTGMYRYTPDDRFSTLHKPSSENWVLEIRNTLEEDEGKSEVVTGFKGEVLDWRKMGNQIILTLISWTNCTGALPCQCVYVPSQVFAIILEGLQLLGLMQNLYVTAT